MNKPVSKLAALGLTAVYASRGRAHTHIHVHSRAYKTAHMAGACTHTNTQVHIHIPAYKTAHTAGTPVSDVHTQVHVHIPAYKTAHTAGTPVRDVHTHIHVHSPAYKTAHMAGASKHTSTCTHPCLQDRTYGRYAGQGCTHTQIYKYKYTSLPTRPHIGQVCWSGTRTYTNTQAHEQSCV